MSSCSSFVLMDVVVKGEEEEVCGKGRCRLVGRVEMVGFVVDVEGHLHKAFERVLDPEGWC